MVEVFLCMDNLPKYHVGFNTDFQPKVDHGQSFLAIYIIGIVIKHWYMQCKRTGKNHAPNSNVTPPVQAWGPRPFI